MIALKLLIKHCFIQTHLMGLTIARNHKAHLLFTVDTQHVRSKLHTETGFIIGAYLEGCTLNRN